MCFRILLLLLEVALFELRHCVVKFKSSLGVTVVQIILSYIFFLISAKLSMDVLFH